MQTGPGYYRQLQPTSAYHPGAPGWSTAPVPGWAQNPALVGPSRQGVGAPPSFGFEFGSGPDVAIRTTVALGVIGLMAYLTIKYTPAIGKAAAG